MYNTIILFTGAFLQQATARGRQTTYVLGIDHEGILRPTPREQVKTNGKAAYLPMVTICDPAKNSTQGLNGIFLYPQYIDF